jgi:hypothetical protein
MERFPDNLEDEDDPTSTKEGAGFGYFIARNVARALAKMAEV